ncbi:MAG: PAS domain-containing protein [Bacteroidales bacterium]|nr:PAS domain-containing protein [Bacteroidales bacterium]
MNSQANQVVEDDIHTLISDYIKTNHKIIHQVRFLKNIISQLNIAIFIHDLRKLRHIWTNDNYFNIIGYSDKEVKQMGPDWAKQNYHPDDIEIIGDRIEYFRQGEGVAFSGIYRIRHKDGHWVWVYSNSIVYKRDKEGLPEQILGICIDFTDNFKTMKQFKDLYRENQQLRHELGISCLTKREKQIIRQIAGGKTSQEIADELHISIYTANNHRKNILKKLELKNIADLVHFASECGLD